MTDDPNLLQSNGEPNPGNAQAIIDIAVASTDPKPLSEDNRFEVVTIPSGGSAWLIDKLGQGELYDDNPLRARGEAEAHDAVSLATFVMKYGDSNAEVWASERDRKLVAIINAGYPLVAGDDTPVAGWGDHRVTYQAVRTPGWVAWCQQDGKMLDQREFAELIEDRLSDIVDPPSLDMLEVAQSIEGTIGATFKSSRRLSNGERKLVYEETVQTQAGSGGELEVPEKFSIRVAPYEGADFVDVECRLRVRINGGPLKLGYKIIDRDEIERDAFRSVVAGVNGLLADAPRDFGPVLMGVPAAAQTPFPR